jgi:glycosyltransferase involved in cell wall biosynthesis
MRMMKDKEVALIAHTFNPFLNDQKDHPFKNLKCWIDINPMEHGFQYKGFDGKAHKFVNGKCDIYFTAPTIQTVEMPSLYHSANVGIQLSKGEAWDLICGDLIACGTPVIASNSLGHEEYIVGAPSTQKELIVPITGLEIAKDDKWFDGNQGEWEIPSKEVFESLLESTYNNEKYLNKSEELATHMETNFSWSKAVDTLIEEIQIN